MVFNPETWHAH